MLPIKFRRSISVVIPLITSLSLFGLLDGIIKINENIMSTGITLGILLAISNLVLIYLVYRHQVP